MKKIFFFAIMLILSVSINNILAQGVAIGEQGSLPDNSAILDMQVTDKGFLPPRLTADERDAIDNPAEGLIIYNTDEKCLQFNFGTPNNPGWICTDGTSCEPQAIANAGENQLIIDATTTTLNANTPLINQEGEWEILSGLGGTVEDINNPNSIFNGVPNEQYVLRWTVTNICGENYDDVIIDFQLDCPSVGDYVLGGLVAYIIPGEGCSGIIISLNIEAFDVQWGCRGTLVGTSPAVGEGQNNSEAIINFHDNMEPSYYINPEQCHVDNDGTVAAKFCEGEINGYSDWFLPSFEDMEGIHQQLIIEYGYSYSYETLWTSTESAATSARLFTLSTGSPWNFGKDAVRDARCVRYFSE